MYENFSFNKPNLWTFFTIHQMGANRSKTIFSNF